MLKVTVDHRRGFSADYIINVSFKLDLGYDGRKLGGLVLI